MSFSRARSQKGEKQGSFDFLGFSFYIGKSRKGAMIPMLRTSRKRIRSKLVRVKEWARTMRSRVRLRELWKAFASKIRGHIEYYAVSFNLPNVSRFICFATRIFLKWMNRRGGKRRISWERFSQFMKAFPLPTVKLRHPLFALQPR